VYTINTYYEDYSGLRSFVEEHHEQILSDNSRSVLVQVFCGICERDFIESLLRQIKELVPRADIIGTTTSGEIMNGGISALKTVLSFSVFEETAVDTFLKTQSGNTSLELGESIAASPDSGEAKLMILFSTGMTVDARQLLKGIQSVNPQLPVAGGIAGDNFFNKKSFVFRNSEISDCGVAGAVLKGGNLAVNQHWHLCWTPIGKEMTITKTDGARVYTIDNVPAYQIYRNYLGFEEKSSSILNSIFPLIANRHGVETVRVPSRIYDDDSIEFLGDPFEGEKIRFSYGHVDMILDTIDSLIREISDKAAQSIFVYSCVLRRGFLQDAAEIETSPLQKIAPTSGFFTNGEFYHAENTNQLLMATMTTLALSESVSGMEKKSVCDETPSECVTPPGDNVSFRNIEILKALTNLVNRVTVELGERTGELERLNGEIEHRSTHDALTSLFNRRFYELMTEKLDAAPLPLGVLICDVDGLKLINDTLGHHSGDHILKATADIFRKSIPSDVIPFRIGGDEFAILLPGNTAAQTAVISEKIHGAVEEYNAANPVIPLSISVGAAHRDSSGTRIPELVKEADSGMYREKLRKGKEIRTVLVRKLISQLTTKDSVNEDQIIRMQDLAARFAKVLNLGESVISYLRLFVRYHDIGKVGIPDSILFKSAPLTRKEKSEMQRHCEIGFRIAQSSPELMHLADGILKHHEWWNGQGYPLGLEEENIPLECRIMSIISAYNSMINDRPYQKARSHADAIDELRRCAGTQFDPGLTEKFIAMMNG
jgi:diguanylate cyclase (GGDEF)-like protein